MFHTHTEPQANLQFCSVYYNFFTSLFINLFSVSPLAQDVHSIQGNIYTEKLHAMFRYGSAVGLRIGLLLGRIVSAGGGNKGGGTQG
jgi:hypothetical protein